MTDSPFEGRSILDLEAERAQLEHALDCADDPAPRPDLPRMRARLEAIRREIGALGDVGR